jgi:hypothetical protein
VITSCILNPLGLTVSGHYSVHIGITKLIVQLQAMARSFLVMFRGRRVIMMKHVDDKSAADLPQQPRTGTGVSAKISIAVSGRTDFADEQFDAYLTDATVASNASINFLLNELLIDVLFRRRDEKVLILVFDCCINNRNVLVAIAISKFFTDTGLFKIVAPIFLQRYHSKHLTDRA